MGVPTPTFIPEPFANHAAGGLINFPIPDAPPGSPLNAASWSQGFPSTTMQPIVAGGLPPLGQDVNGILFTLSQSTYALQAGQLYGFNATFTGSISGYNVGAVLAMGDGTGLWLNTSAGNQTNPDNDPTSLNWVPGIAYGRTSLTGLTGGTVTLAPSQGKYALIFLAGTLTSNLTVVLPTTLQQWLIVNNTTGAFSTTAKTAAGTGVAIPQGGASSPTGVYCDGTNINLSNSPLSVPIATAATPLTLLERDNTGQGFLTRVNLSSNPAENPVVGAVLVQDSALDGYGRWASLSYFKSVILNISGALTNSSSWWRSNPDGSIEQGGSFTYAGSLSTMTIPFIVPFSARVLNIGFTSSVGGFTPGWNAALPGNNLSNFVAQFNGMGGTSQTIYWRALGV